MPMDDSELLKIFWTEVAEYVEGLNANLMALEMSVPEDDGGSFVERLREMNRVAHSMKGAARTVGEKTVETLGYHMEEVFDAALKQGLAITPEIADLLYDALDQVQAAVDGEPADDDALAEIVRGLEQAVQNGRASEDMVHIPPAAAPTQALAPIPPAQDLAEAPPEPPITIRTGTMPQVLVRPVEDTVRVSVDKLEKLMAESSELLVMRLQAEERKQQTEALRRLQSRWAKEWRAVRAAYIRLSRRLQSDDVPDDLRILFDFLETNQKYLASSSRELNTLTASITADGLRLASLSDELQAGIGALRLVPFESILAGLQRTLRDAARETQKDVHLDVIGSATEIDKTVLEHLKDPLMHLIRNAVDHGIEPPGEREELGKPPVGWIYLKIETRGSEIMINVGDDGRGIDAQRVKSAAIAQGILSPSAAQSLSDDEVRALIFQPGLSTRQQVTAISGRGVGMDVVRDRVESLRGRVGVQSTPGRGTVTTLSVPVSLTRIRCLVLRVGTEQYALPSLAVQRMERAARDALFSAEGRTMLALGEQAIPLVSLADMLGVSLPSAPPETPFIRVVILNAAERTVAFEVDELESERELVLKPLGTELAHTRYISGAALLGSGDVLLVLDANDLVRGALHLRQPMRRIAASTPAPQEELMPKRLRVLIVDDSITTRTLEKNILETAGCDVRVAFDGVQAWEMLGEYEFDVVVSDVEMPRMDGFALTKRIKSAPATRHLPVVLLTSLNKPQHRELGLEAGADAYLVKQQFDQDELLRTLQSVL